VTLENIQRGTNAQRVAAGNVSASNDPTQWQHDGREQLIKGAELAAAGRTLGMSEEETLAAVSRQFRRQHRADDRVTQQDVLRQMVQSAATTTSDVGGGEIKGVTYQQDDDVAYAFGEDVGYNYTEGGKKVTRADDEQTYRANDRGFTEDPETGLVRRENFEETRGSFETVAPKSVMADALQQLEGAKQQESGVLGAISRVFGGSPAVDNEVSTAQDALRRHLEPEGPQDARVGRALVRQDNRRFSPEMRAQNDEAVGHIADTIARTGFTINGPGAMADENIGRIAEIRSLGKIGETAHVVRTANDAIKGQAARRADGGYSDSVTGAPLAIQGPDLPSVLAGDRTPNNASSSNAANAPQTAYEWMAASQPDYREGGRTFGDYPQVDITRETTNFAQKLRELEGFGMQGVSANIRSVDELQRVVDHIVGKAPNVERTDNRGRVKKGVQLYRFDAETGKNVPSSAAGTAEVMNLLRMNEGDQQRLANAMFQLDAAKRSSVNQNATGTYLSRTGEPTKGVVFDASEAMNDSSGQAQVARIPKGSTIRTGTDDKGKPVRSTIVTELSKLQGEGAQKPFIGQVEGEKPRIDRKKPGKMGSGVELAQNIQRQAESRARGKQVDQEAVDRNTVKARLVEEREKRDSAKREAQKEQIRSFTPANLRQRGRYS
jgi:hypothetical protein